MTCDCPCSATVFHSRLPLTGLVLAKAMLETRGLLWPWAIHAVQDVVIFAFLVLASN